MFEHLFPLTGVALVALGLYGFMVLTHPLRQLLAVNVIGAGIFLIMGGLGRGDDATDPFSQALVITGIVVAVALTAFGAALIARIAKDSAKDPAKAGEAEIHEATTAAPGKRDKGAKP